MSIVYNGTEIENITYNGTALDTVNYNNTEVYVSVRTLTVKRGNYITSIIINGTTYSDDTTVNIKPGTSVTLNCNLKSNTTSGDIITTYSFYRWTGYTNNYNKSFTFTMPNENITYRAVGNYSTSFNWPSNGSISEATFLNGINNGSYNTSLVGRYVALAESNSSSPHNWLIVRVNSNSYDLWYEGKRGEGRWRGGDSYRYWTNQSTTGNNGYVRSVCYNYKSNLSSSIQDKLKTGLNANCGSDTVVILSARQLGCTESTIVEESDNTSNTAIPYFNSDDRRSIGSYYWTSSAYSNSSGNLWCVRNNGTLSYTNYANNYGVVPAIRVGK